MSTSVGINMAFAGLVLLAGVLSNKLSRCFNMPVLLMFLGVGMIVGSDGLGLVMWHPGENASPINALGSIAMCFILYSGGLGTRYDSIRNVVKSGISLATLGVVLTMLLLGGCAYAITRAFGYESGMLWWLLLAALISSTDAAAMFAILRGQGVNLAGRLQPLLELESGSNDPMAALLTLMMIQLMMSPSGFSWLELPLLLYRIGMGVVIGVVVSFLGKLLFQQRFEYEGLYYVLGVAVVLLSFGVAELLDGNGFLSVYICGLVMGNTKFNYQTGLKRFNEGIAWLMQVILFTSLGVLVDPEDLVQVKVLVPGILLSLSLMFIARPGAVFISMMNSDFSFREKVLISWAGLRGAAPIVLATFPLVAGVPESELMFNMVFFMVIGSVLFQGLTLMPFAKWLKLAKPYSSKMRSPLEMETLAGGTNDLHEFEVAEKSVLDGISLAEAQFPPGVLVTLIRRENTFIPASGSSVIQSGDGLLIIGQPQKLQELAERFFPDSGYKAARDFRMFKRKVSKED